MYFQGDKVKHAKKPEWGSGIVLEDEKDGKVVINFRDAGEKTISTTMDFLRRVSKGDLSDSKSTAQPNRRSSNIRMSSLQKVDSGKREKQCCIYTIKTLSDLKAAYKNGGKGTFTEDKPWITGRELLKDAENEDKDLFIIFANADSIWDLLFYAKLTEIDILPNTDKESKSNSMTRYSFEGMRRYPQRNPPYNKTDLLLDSSGARISADFIRPYAICRKPNYL